MPCPIILGKPEYYLKILLAKTLILELGILTLKELSKIIADGRHSIFFYYYFYFFKIIKMTFHVNALLGR